MAQMKKVVLPILEEIAAEPGSRMEVYQRGYFPVEWGAFKRIIGHLASTGMISVETDRGGRLTITEAGKEAISYE